MRKQIDVVLSPATHSSYGGTVLQATAKGFRQGSFLIIRDVILIRKNMSESTPYRQGIASYVG
jgi:hypothetical protein